jgi:membrane protein DedA with SNARE-associated domain
MADWTIRLIDWGGYWGVFALMLLETIFPPIPSEVIMPISGLRAANGPMTLGGVIAAGTAGAMTGNLFWYFVARSVGLGRFKRFIDRHGRWLTMDWYDVEKVQRLFGRFGAALVLVGRMTPTIRTFVSVPAGLVHMSLARFFIWSAIGTAGWSALLALAGYGLGLQFGEVEQVLGPISTGIVVLLVLFYLYRQITWNQRRARRGTGA